jgi:[ribosomal protein S5]-alanine N-acetyltransferase
MTYRLPDSPAVLSADGVHLRRFAEGDVDLLLAGARDPEVVRWTFMPADLDVRRARILVERGLVMEGEGRFHRYVISAAPDAPSAGQVLIVLQDDDDPRCADIVYWLLPEARGRGLATRAARLLIRWAFDEAGVSKLALYTKVGNDRSDRVAERCGFHFEGTVVQTRGGREFTLRRWILLP